MEKIISTMQDILRQEAGITGDASPTLLPFFLDTPEDCPCILILPGGGYSHTSPREAEPVARAFNKHGFHALVLHYRVAPHLHPAPLLDASNTLALLRKNATKLKVDAHKIVLCGFSAGGHLAASLGTHWNKAYLQNKTCTSPGLNRPDGLILSYPVITSGIHAHRGSFEHLLGDGGDPALLEEMSLEKQVTKTMPPCFIWHTGEDQAVPVENAFLLAEALRKEKIPMEMHIFPEGPHGLSLATEETDETEDASMTIPHVSIWMDLCARWVKMFIR
jgi:acetyl esterase/lipase